MVISQGTDRFPNSGGIVIVLIMHTPGMIMTDDSREHPHPHPTTQRYKSEKRWMYFCHFRIHRRIPTMRPTISSN